MEIIYAIVESARCTGYNNPWLNAAFLTIDSYAMHENTHAHTHARICMGENARRPSRRSHGYFTEFFTLLKYQKLFRVFARFAENVHYFRKHDRNMSNIYPFGLGHNVNVIIGYLRVKINGKSFVASVS